MRGSPAGAASRLNCCCPISLTCCACGSNTANETMVEDYVQSHLAGNPVFSRGKSGHRETLSCFDKTRPIAASKRPGGHGPARVCIWVVEMRTFLCTDLHLSASNATR